MFFRHRVFEATSAGLPIKLFGFQPNVKMSDGAQRRSLYRLVVPQSSSILTK